MDEIKKNKKKIILSQELFLNKKCIMAKTSEPTEKTKNVKISKPRKMDVKRQSLMWKNKKEKLLAQVKIIEEKLNAIETEPLSENTQ